DFKFYKIILLLNCLDKIFEKIIAEKLFYFIEIIDLLYFDQINNKKQKSAINAAISLLLNIEINKHEKKLISVLFFNIKNVYNHLNKSQIIKICKNANFFCMYKLKSFFSH